MSKSDENESNATSETLQWKSREIPRELSGVTLGDFEIQRLLGKGGMGEVYLANQISLNRPVAFKVLRSDLLANPTYLSRFEAEATAVAKLNHPNIVHVYTLGKIDSYRFIAMEYVLGTNLRDYLKKKGALDYPLALSIMRQAALAIGAAGELGLVHRDIKPENLLLTRKGQVKVADFGLCRDLDADRVNITQTGVTMGTPLYMSPEQAQGHETDHRSDLYSLGVTFYHMIAGVPPFRADTPLALALKHVRDKPASLAVHRHDIPPELDRLILKLMEKSRDARYQSAAELLRDIAKIRDSLSAGTTTQSTIMDIGATAPPSVIPPTPPSPTQASPILKNLSTSTAQSLRSLFFPDPMEAKPLFGVKTVALLLLLGVAMGAGFGWSARPEDLLGEKAPQGKSLPGLMMTPAWQSFEKRANPEDQYYHVLLAIAPDEMHAAWLSVPGYYPNSREWISRSYTQLARTLLRDQDVERLKILANEIEEWDEAQTHEKDLANVIRVGVEAIEGDLEGVVKDFDSKIVPKKLPDPALVELSFRVLARAEQYARTHPGTPERVLRNLTRLRNELLQILIFAMIADPDDSAGKKQVESPNGGEVGTDLDLRQGAGRCKSAEGAGASGLICQRRGGVLSWLI